MAWTYSGDPSSSRRDAIRFEIGATNTDEQLLQDEEIDYILSVEPMHLAAAARCAEVIAREYSRLADTQLGPAETYLGRRAKHYYRLSKDLRKRATGYGGPIPQRVGVHDDEQIEINIHENDQFY